MKKCLTGLSMVLVMLMLVACGGGAKSDDPIVGEWKFSGMSFAGQEFSVDDIPGFDADIMKFDVQANGKFTITVAMDPSNPTATESYTGKWENKDGNYTFKDDADSITVTVDDGGKTLTLDLGSDMKMTFSK